MRLLPSELIALLTHSEGNKLLITGNTTKSYIPTELQSLCEILIIRDSKLPEIELLDAFKEVKLADNDIVIAFGGGRVIDVAKAFLERLDLNYRFVVCPTTAGSGSEATSFAVQYVGGVKRSIMLDRLLPDYIVYFDVLKQSSFERASFCDSVLQVIESQFSLTKTKSLSSVISELSFLLGFDIFDKKIVELDIVNIKPWRRQLLATFSGDLINRSRTNLAHSLSYHLTSKHGITHGYAVLICWKAIISCRNSIFTNSHLLNSEIDQVEYIVNLLSVTYLPYVNVADGIRYSAEEHLSEVNLDRLSNFIQQINEETLLLICEEIRQILLSL